jgi:subtilisin family serine protease
MARSRTKLIVAAAVIGIFLSSTAVSGSATSPNRLPSAARFYERQWNLQAVNAADAWGAGHLGDDSVRVALIDTGIDYTHPDLAGRVDMSPNGSISLLPMSCPGGEPGPPASKEEVARAEADGLRPFVDYHSHGTAVAGLIVSNGKWLAGVTQRTTLVAIKVNAATNMRRNCLTVYLEAIYEAVDREADVIHLSFPVEFDTTLFPGAVTRINQAMKYAHDSGAVVVAAAGNNAAVVDPESTQFRFCNADYVLCVSGTAPTAAASITGPWTEPDAIWPLTNFGPAVDVAGPAGTVSVPHSSVWLLCSRYAVAPGRPCDESGVIWSSTGTSFAAAVTSGLAAQLVAIVGKDKPDVVEALIRDTSRELDPLGWDPPGTWDPYYGDGFIDVAAAVAAAEESLND